ncbi:hypothetical protein Pcinc_027697 [Petrolisthes cinctipes]|uniref:Uncharacterized protein n=1 Tax=Petrolisthes cinctipes TaxID=88211 RepID=A0AAE1K895_PETCI|nr:hypothetical protein Pcinc_027697 [Petrolisthes cinctipes]
MRQCDVSVTPANPFLLPLPATTDCSLLTYLVFPIPLRLSGLPLFPTSLPLHSFPLVSTMCERRHSVWCLEEAWLVVITCSSGTV